MNIKKYFKFISWWVSVLLMLTVVFWSYYFGLVSKIWASDVTMITSIIAGIFLFVNIFSISRLSLQVADDDYVLRNHKTLLDKFESIWFISEQLMALGMLGTVIGLIHMLANSFVGTAGDAAMQTLLSNMWASMGLALYTNAVGLIASIVLKVQVYILSYGINVET
jgi:hypothetical protein